MTDRPSRDELKSRLREKIKQKRTPSRQGAVDDQRTQAIAKAQDAVMAMDLDATTLRSVSGLLTQEITSKDTMTNLVNQLGMACQQSLAPQSEASQSGEKSRGEGLIAAPPTTRPHATTLDNGGDDDEEEEEAPPLA